jgi:hypothetical protein
MLTVLATKELRETGLIALAAVAMFAHLVTSAMGYPLLPFFTESYSGAIPFLRGSFAQRFVYVAMGLALALGFRQSAWESMQGTYLFLLHRPASWARIIGVKLGVGLVLYLLCAAAPILMYAWWAATPGTHASPFEWSMTWPVWKAWTVGVNVYLAAFLCGIRPAHWLWSRLWPLAGIGMLVLLIQYLPWWPILGLGLLMALNVVLVAAIFTVVHTRDYP